METTFILKDIFNSPFLADGNIGMEWRRTALFPLLKSNPDATVVLDCTGVENMTDSFANATFGALLCEFPAGKRVFFRGATPLIKDFILNAWNIEKNRRERAGK